MTVNESGDCPGPQPTCVFLGFRAVTGATDSQQSNVSEGHDHDSDGDGPTAGHAQLQTIFPNAILIPGAFWRKYPEGRAGRGLEGTHAVLCWRFRCSLKLHSLSKDWTLTTDRLTSLPLQLHFTCNLVEGARCS